MILPEVIKIEHIEYICPNGSCGTGYSQPDKFKFYLDNGKTFTKLIDTWYCPKSVIAEICKNM